MAVIGVRKSVFDGLSAGRKLVFRWALSKLNLGDPAVWSDGSNEWYVSEDTRIGLKDAAILGSVAAGIASLPADWTLPTITLYDGDGRVVGSVVDYAKAKQQVYDFVKDVLVWPVDVPEGDDPWSVVLAAQATPAALRMADHVPESWSVVEDGV